MVVTGFERNEKRGTPGRVPRGLQGPDLGVILPRPGVPALANDAATPRDDGPHQGVRRNGKTPALGKPTGEIHKRTSCQVDLSPIRTLTVGAGLRFAKRTFTGSTPGSYPGARGLPVGNTPSGLTAGAGIPPAPEKLR